jgi:hypothetical protein
MDPSKRPGHACDVNGNLKDLSEMDWDEPSDNDAPDISHIQPAKIKHTEQKTLLGKKVFIERVTHVHRKMTSAKESEARKWGVNLTLKDKVDIVEWMVANPDKMQADVLAHFHPRFPKLSQPTISRLKRDQNDLLWRAMDITQLSYKRPRQTEHPEMDLALQKWCLQKLGQGIKLSGELIRGKAVEFMESLNIPIDMRSVLSNGWLDSLKQ